MDVLEDPIFDPWSPEHAEEDASAEAAEAVPPRAEPVPPRLPAQRAVLFGPVALPVEATSPAARPPSPVAALPEAALPGARASLRRLATARLDAIARRLRLARHRASLEDLLDEPTRLIRFELRPWRNPLLSVRSKRPAVLELGLSAESVDVITAWYWLDDVGEAPYKTTSVPAGELTAAWIDRAVLDFVAKALERG